jgi:TonB family protein
MFSPVRRDHRLRAGRHTLEGNLPSLTADNEVSSSTFPKSEDQVKSILIAVVFVCGALAQAASDPALLDRIEPEYTPQARSQGLEGVVMLYAEVTSDGRTANVKVIKSLDTGLDANAIAAVERWRFRPGMRNGKPVSVSATIEVRFQLPRYPVLPSEAPRPQALPLPDENWPDIFRALQMIPVR